MLGLYWKTQYRGQPRGAAGTAGQNAKPLRIAADLIEEQRGRLRFFHVEFADRTELEIPVHAADFPQLPQPLNVAQPMAKIERIPHAAFSAQSFMLHNPSCAGRLLKNALGPAAAVSKWYLDIVLEHCQRNVEPVRRGCDPSGTCASRAPNF